MSNLVKHALRELELAGYLKETPDNEYENMTAKAVIDLMEVFSTQGHSGFSASRTLALFERLAQFKTLTPITSKPEEWSDVSQMSGTNMWQNLRDPSFFSTDGGKTWYSLDEK